MVQNWDLVRHAIDLLDQGKTVVIIATQVDQFTMLKYLLGSTYEQHIIFDFLFNYWDKCYNIQPGTIVLYETRRYVIVVNIFPMNILTAIVEVQVYYDSMQSFTY